MTEVSTLSPLSAAEAATLRNCENVIGASLRAFREVGSALMRVREFKLYRARFDTFEDYCEARWQLSRTRAYELMGAATVVSAIGGQAPDLPAPTNERQARELAKVPEPERADVWRDAHERTDGKPTADAVRQARERRTAPAPAPAIPIRPSLADPEAFVAEVADAHSIPDRAEVLAKRAGAFRKALVGVSAIMEFDAGDIAEAIDDDDLRSLESAASRLMQLSSDVRAARQKPGTVIFMKPKVVAS